MRSCQAPPFWKFGRRLNLDLQQKTGDAYYASVIDTIVASLHSSTTFAIILSSALSHSSRLLKLWHLELYNASSCFHKLISCVISSSLHSCLLDPFLSLIVVIDEGEEGERGEGEGVLKGDEEFLDKQNLLLLTLPVFI